VKAYSLDLRTKIVAAVASGKPKTEVARVFGVGLSTVKRYLHQQQQTGTLVPKRHPGGAPSIPPAQYPVLWAQLEAHPTAFLDEQCRSWEATTGTRVSTSTMSRMIRRMGWTRKKGRWVPASETSATG
jgi:transposase